MKRILAYTVPLLFLAAACGALWYWWQHGRFIETTDNAYLRGDITPISSKVAGYVEAVLVADNQTVTAGQPLVSIQDLEFMVRLERGRKALSERQAALHVVREQRKQQTSEIRIATAQLEMAEAELQRDTELYERFKRLYADDVVSWFDYSDALMRKQKALAQQTGARANLNRAEQEVNVLFAEEQQIIAEIARCKEDVKLLEQDVADTQICAPVSGTVGNKQVRPGQYVKTGSNLMALIPNDKIWVEANFKEIQLARMHVGQTVVIDVDAYPQLNVTGKIDSLAPASGAEFSLLPPENATGNFTKIVQRIPVKISIDHFAAMSSKLRPGMSVEVSINTKERGSTHPKHLAQQ